MDGSLHNGTDPQDAGKTTANERLRTRKKLAVEGKSAYLRERDGELLRRLIEGTVALRTAEKLSARYDRGLEHDHIYVKALAEFRLLILDPRTRISSLRAFLEHALPPGRPLYVKVLFLETIARQLGKDWVADDCDFIDVTIGSARLQELATSLSKDLREAPRGADTPSALILYPLGEQHTLMPCLTGLLFESLGWTVQVLEPAAAKTPALARALETADVACIGWSNIRLAKELKSLVQDVQKLSKGARLPILIGGKAALDSIDFLVGLGIDCICDSVFSAVKICESYCELERTGRKPLTAGQTAVVSPNGIDWRAP